MKYFSMFFGGDQSVLESKRVLLYIYRLHHAIFFINTDIVVVLCSNVLSQLQFCRTDGSEDNGQTKGKYLKEY